MVTYNMNQLIGRAFKTLTQSIETSNATKKSYYFVMLCNAHLKVLFSLILALLISFNIFRFHLDWCVKKQKEKWSSHQIISIVVISMLLIDYIDVYICIQIYYFIKIIASKYTNEAFFSYHDFEVCCEYVYWLKTS